MTTKGGLRPASKGLCPIFATKRLRWVHSSEARTAFEYRGFPMRKSLHERFHPEAQRNQNRRPRPQGPEAAGTAREGGAAEERQELRRCRLLRQSQNDLRS